MTNTLQCFVKRFLCFIQGHMCEATGRFGHVLREWHCLRCGRVFISHRDYALTLLPATPESDEILTRHMKAIHKNACTPNTAGRTPAVGSNA